ncbi:MAG: M50 family metallopeptidase [Armatimonadota bacterium]
MTNILWMPALVFLIGVLVFFHELGHFTVAKLLKIKVEEFAFGFGPKWIRLFKRGDTEYTIHPVPLGGFVKMAGEAPGEADAPGGFLSRPWYQRALVSFAGPFASFFLAYLIFSTMGLTFGLPIGNKVQNKIDMIMPGSVAQKAGFRVGDEIVSINGVRMKTWEETRKTVSSSPGKELAITVKRDGRELVLRATPKPEKEGSKMVGRLGFIASPELVRVGVVESMRFGTKYTTGFISIIVKTVFSRDVAQNVGGPIAIASETKNSLERGSYGFLQLIGLLSMSLGVFNLIPIPVLDGGHILLSFVEGIKGKRLSPRTIEIAQMVGLATIAIIFILIMALDLSRVASGKLFN